MLNIDFVYKKNSQTLKLLLSFCEKDPSIKINSYPDMLFRNDSQSYALKSYLSDNIFGNVIIIEETDSFLQSEEVFDQVSAKCPADAVKIILTENRNFYNVVQWVHKGATDVISTFSLTEKSLFNAISTGRSYVRSQNEDVQTTDEDATITDEQEQFRRQRIILPKNVCWEKIGSTENLPMTLVMLSITFDNAKKRFDAGYTTKLLNNTKVEIINEASVFGGKSWFWTGNIGGIVFHFEDHVNLAVTACIAILSKIALIFNEKIPGRDMPNFKIAIHTGTDNFRMTNTEDINSKVINFTSHLLTKRTPPNTVCISDAVYNSLSIRLTHYFKPEGQFEKHKIYVY